MNYGDLADMLSIRLRRMGLDDDAAACLTYLYQTEIELAQTYDLLEYTVLPDPGTPWFVTTTGYEAYDLPADFWRLVHPRTEGTTGERGKQGVKLDDGSSRRELTFEDTITFDAHDRTQTGVPSTFTIAGRRMYLYPTPNSNSDAHYTVNGPYIRQIARPDFDDPVVLPEPKVLVTTALVRLVEDSGKPVGPVLLQEFQRDQVVLANNRARQRQSFFDWDKHKRVGTF